MGSWKQPTVWGSPYINMKIRLFYLKLELKRALKCLPLMAAGAAVLMVFMGAAALLAGKALYGGPAAGRITVGVALPENDVLARQVTSMLSSLESVKSICDFSYMSREDCLEGMEKGKLLASLLIPEGFVQDILSGVNTPVPVLLPKNGGVESRIFKELADAGARTLSAAQAGIYAGDELLERFHCSEARAQLERDLNRLYLEYSLPRGDLFRSTQVSASGDVDPVVFYAISLFILALILSAIPVSGFLLPQKPVLRRQLSLAGVGPLSIVLSRILGLALLYTILLLAAAFTAILTGALSFSPALPAAILLLGLSVSSIAVCAFQAAGNQRGGILFLFLGATALHFFSGGILPLVFLPSAFQKAAPFLPPYIFIETVKMAVTACWEPWIFGALPAIFLAGVLVSLVFEVKRP